MKIEPTRGAGSVGAGKQTRETASGFSLPSETTQEARAVQASAPLASVDALLALQIEEPAGGRRKKQVRRGGQQIDALDRLALATLGEGDDAAALDSLRRFAGDREATGDAGLDDVLREIDVRAAVEIAKREKALRSR
jgi:hypothetical protein